jgi:glutamyl-tRNA reductase
MRVLFVGINHRTAPVELRERFAMPDDPRPQLDAFRQRFPHAECVILSTCNRVEVYAARPTHDPPKGEDIQRFLAERFGVPMEQVATACIHREQDQAISHLFRVCCGLDSMVLGEPQILGQVKRAYESAKGSNAAGPVLHKVFQQAIATAKQARTETGIDAGRVSVGSVAADLARQVFSKFADKTVLGIGAGEVAKLTLRHLLDLTPEHLWLVNRTAERASDLAQKFDLAHPLGGARPWDQLDELLVEADIVVTSTAAPKPILTPDRFKPILKRRRHRPLFVIDLAVPRDADPAIGSMTNLYLYNIDDLQAIVAQSLGLRGDEAQACERHVSRAVAACMSEITHADLGQLIRRLRSKLHNIGEDERQRTLKKMADCHDPGAVGDALDEHTHRLINKILHMPLSQLNQRNRDAPLGFYAAALRRLFDLDEDDTQAPSDKPDPPAVPRESTANLHGE